jgi:hypothetical protein
VPEIALEYSAKSLTLRVPLSSKVARGFGLDVTSFRPNTKGKAQFIAFNSRDPDGSKLTAAVDRDDKIPYEIAPFRHMFTRTFAKLAQLDAKLVWDSQQINSKLEKKVVALTDNVRNSTWFVFVSPKVTLISVPIHDTVLANQGIDVVKIASKTIKHDEVGFPAAFEEAKQTFLSVEP